MPQHGLQGQVGIAQAAADIDVVAWLRAAAQQSLPRGNLAKYGDADVERALGGIAANQFAAMGVGQVQQAA